jgi:hypothetical protein
MVVWEEVEVPKADGGREYVGFIVMVCFGRRGIGGGAEAELVVASCIVGRSVAEEGSGVTGTETDRVFRFGEVEVTTSLTG